MPQAIPVFKKHLSNSHTKYSQGAATSCNEQVDGIPFQLSFVNFGIKYLERSLHILGQGYILQGDVVLV